MEQQYSPEPHNTFFVRALRQIRKFAWEMTIAIVPALLIAFFIRVEVAAAVEIESGPSMQPNFYQGYRVMVEKVSYHFHLPERGDIVVVDRPGNEASLIKRVMGLPGETVTVHEGHVFIDGQSLEEPWVTYFGGNEYGPATVPEGHVFVVGDNRPQSLDSRVIGPVAIRAIIGRVWLVYWPVEQFRLIP